MNLITGGERCLGHYGTTHVRVSNLGKHIETLDYTKACQW